MDSKIDLLNHGFIRLVDWMGSDVSVVRAARVSHDAAWRAGEDEKGDVKLLRYLWRNHHTTPFEAATMTFEVMAPIFVFRQWHRHRTQSYNELSARYRELPELYYVPKPEDIGTPTKDNKQGRDLGGGSRLASDMLAPSMIDRSCAAAFDSYRALLAQGVPRETARSVLPLATYSHMFTTMNLLNAFRFMTLRRDKHAQMEIRVYADAMLELLKPHYPVCCEALKSIKFVAVEES